MTKRKADDRLGDLALLLKVDGKAWIRVDGFESSTPDDRHFVVTLERDGGAVIRFGDGEKGRRPKIRSENNSELQLRSWIARK